MQDNKSIQVTHLLLGSGYKKELIFTDPKIILPGLRKLTTDIDKTKLRKIYPVDVYTKRTKKNGCCSIM
jgi:hypothetical protein